LDFLLFFQAFSQKIKAEKSDFLVLRLIFCKEPLELGANISQA